MEDRLFSNNRPRGQASSSENTELTEASLVYRQEHPVSSHGQFTSILDESNLLLDNTQEKESS